MRIDFEARTLSCSVGDLVHENTYRRIGVERGDGFRRMWLGTEIHTQRAETRSAEDPNYRPEVGVDYRCAVGEWAVTITGRIDGLSIDRERRRITIEEVKSIHFDLELAALYRSEKMQRHLFQLMLYAWFLSLKPDYEGFEFLPQLVLIDLITGTVKAIDAPFEPEDIAGAFQREISRLVEEIENDRALKMAKRAYAEGITFPHELMRPFQQEMVDAVARAVGQRETLLVSAPTGIGKTAAAIFPALVESLRRGKKLFFLTSKTLQQEMAVKVLETLNDGSFRVLRIRAKQKMCAHTEMICHEDFCPFASNYSEKMQRSGLVSRMSTDLSYFDPDIVFEMARSEEVCPFEVSLELIEQADVIVCDYNYIFDPYVGLKRYQKDDDYSDSVLIIDEAHNLVDRGRGYYSPEIEERALDLVAEHLSMRPQFDVDEWEELVRELRSQLHELAQPLEGTTRQSVCEPDRRFFLRQRNEWERVVLQYITWKISNRLADETDPVIDFYFRLMKFTNLMNEEGEEFSQIIEATPGGLKLKIFCKDPSRFLGEIISGSYATIAMSATLEPFDFYRKTLGFPSDRVSELSLPSPFPRENRKIVVISNVDTTYKERGLHYDTIARTLGEVANANTGNYLALFPSYAFLQEVSARMPYVEKRLMIQRSDMTDYERRSFLTALKDGHDQHLILAVSGGMYAEGVDYQGDMLRGVFVVGPALPAVSFEQELLKRYYDDQYGAGFEYAYLIPGMTRVIQSAGRVIRSEKDVGFIALLCKRFTNASYTRYFPADWYVDSPRELVSKNPGKEIQAFLEARNQPQLRIRY
ncbi:MAG TPA: ATP-dependent DNA helicase [Thermoanaerobaculia bacterium]|nr:ATP-dependent DNA helicase [Thermoanaerobaculia bacterium]